MDAKNTFKTPRINNDATIIISYAAGNGVSNVRESKMKVLGTSNGIQIVGVNNGEKVYVYGTDGELLHSSRSNGESMIVPLPENNIYIVKVGDQTIKIGL